MGNDGGSIPHRREVVKQKQKEERKDNHALAKAKASYCAVSKEPLKQPIAVCRMGLLYNKEEILKRLLEKTMPEAFRHIKKLKDFKEAKVQMKENSDGSNTIICPISQREFNGFHRFLMVWGCGCVFSEEAAKELKMDDKCLVCSHPIESKSEIISLNQSKEEQEAFLKKLDEKNKELEDKKSKKKTKKRHHREEQEKVIQDDESNINNKRQKVEEDEISQKLKQSEAYKSLFKKQYEENKDNDFLSRCVHYGLR